MIIITEEQCEALIGGRKSCLELEAAIAGARLDALFDPDNKSYGRRAARFSRRFARRGCISQGISFSDDN